MVVSHKGKFHQKMPLLYRDLVFVILQFLYECNMYESAKNLEQESKVFFNIKTFTSMISNGKWDEVDKYLRSFTVPEDDPSSTMVFSLIGKEKFLEAHDEQDFVKALSIFDKDLKPLYITGPRSSREFAELIPLKNFRESREYRKYGDTQAMRAQLVAELMNWLKTNPKIQHKLHFPRIENSRLKNLLFQSCKWQHFICHNDVANPRIETFFVDHVCERSSSSTRRQDLDLQLLVRDPDRNAQNYGAGPSSAPQTDFLNFRDPYWRRP